MRIGGLFLWAMGPNFEELTASVFGVEIFDEGSVETLMTHLHNSDVICVQY